MHSFDSGVMHEAIENKISLNPVLNSFQLAVNEYRVTMPYIDAFMNSMKKDLTQKEEIIINKNLLTKV